MRLFFLTSIFQGYCHIKTLNYHTSSKSTLEPKKNQQQKSDY